MSEDQSEKNGPGLAKPGSTESNSGTQALGAIKLQKRKSGGRSSGGLKSIQVTIPSATVAAKLPQNRSVAETIDRERRRGPTAEDIAAAAEHAQRGAELLAHGDKTLALEQYDLAVQKDPNNMDHQLEQAWVNYVCGMTRAAPAERRFQVMLKQADVGDYAQRSRILRYLAEVVLAGGENDRAHDLFGQAKTADPNNTEAVRGFESTMSGNNAKDQGGGWFSRMFKRNK